MTESWNDFYMRIYENGQWVISYPDIQDVFPLPPTNLLILTYDFNLYLYNSTDRTAEKLASADTFMGLLQDTFDTYKPLSVYYDPQMLKGWVTHSNFTDFIHIDYSFKSDANNYIAHKRAAITFQRDNLGIVSVIFETFKDGCYNLYHTSTTTHLYPQCFAYVGVEDGVSCAILSGCAKASTTPAECYAIGTFNAIIPGLNIYTLDYNGALHTHIKFYRGKYIFFDFIEIPAGQIEYYEARDPYYRYKYIKLFECGATIVTSFTQYIYSAPEIIIDNIEYVRYRTNETIYPDPEEFDPIIIEHQGYVSPGGKIAPMEFDFEKSMCYDGIEEHQWINACARYTEAGYCHQSGIVYEMNEEKKTSLERIFSYRPWAHYNYAQGRTELADNSSWDDLAFVSPWSGYEFAYNGAAAIRGFNENIGLVDTDYPEEPYAGATFLGVDEIWLANVTKKTLEGSVIGAFKLGGQVYIRDEYYIYELTTNIHHYIRPTSITTDEDYIHIGGSYTLDTTTLSGYYFVGNDNTGKPVYVNTAIPEASIINTTYDLSTYVNPKYITVGVSGEAYVKLYSYDSSLVHGTILPQRAMLCGRGDSEDVSATLPSGHVYTTAEVGAEVFILGASGDIYNGNTPSSGLASLEWDYWGTIATPVQTSLLYNEEYLFTATPSGTAPLYRTPITGVDFETACSGLPEHVIILDLEEELYADR